MPTDYVADMFAAANIATLTSNYVTMITGFVVLGVIGLAFAAVMGGLGKGKRAVR
ncbi:MAG: hypothetical protein NDI73_00035 [Desulfuromonadales bacterium]|nr:hypothetical protein [Desulfuromonadales bacterium]